MVVELGFGFVRGGERERHKLDRGEILFWVIYILLCRYIILTCYIGK